MAEDLKLVCVVRPTCRLTENTARILRDTFGLVVPAQGSPGVQAKE